MKFFVTEADKWYSEPDYYYGNFFFSREVVREGYVAVYENGSVDWLTAPYPELEHNNDWEICVRWAKENNVEIHECEDGDQLGEALHLIGEE
jgi:hypothetical protein